MDQDISIMFICRNGELLTKENTRASLSTMYNRKQLPKNLADIADDIWQERAKNNQKLYNGTKFRIDSVTESADRCTIFNIGITCYRDYIGTNWSPKAKTILELGRQECSNPHAYMSDALGVGAFVETSDNFVIFIHRSAHCGEAVGLWDIPGGHPEPEELVGKIDMADINVEDLSPSAVIHEIFDSIKREIQDEVNIPNECLSAPDLIGIARNHTSSGRPSAEFLVRCSLSSKEILDLYNKGTQTEADESTNIKLISVENVMNMQVSNPSLWASLAPSAKGCVILYRLHQQQIKRRRHLNQKCNE